ncbi:hypothetical protein [Nibrella saemangeumensis]|uniref:hypothetical protein n=1 Tax=Nibrella saemangeumensis TaxID=1084526 RepID=UPI0031E8971E
MPEHTISCLTGLCRLWVLWFCLAGTICIAQVDNGAARPSNQKAPGDSVAAVYPTTVIEPKVDSATKVRDSLFYTTLKQKMYRHRLTRELYNAFIHDVYNSSARAEEVNVIEENPFKSYAGKVIGTIHVRRLGVFGQSVYDTLRRPHSWFERFANRVHTNTREGVIRRSYLLFREGDLVEPDLLRDNERILRNLPVFVDARILIVPREGSEEFVDVYVITQDVWSLLADGSVGGLDRFSVGLEQRNVRGLGHTLKTQFFYNKVDPFQKAEYLARYTVPYIGKTFLTAQADLMYLRHWKQFSARVFRPFLTPDTKYAGSLELGHYKIRNRLLRNNQLDTAAFFPISYNYSDVWLGRSFKMFFGNPQEQERARLVIAGRLTRYTYLIRPEVGADTNQLYQNSRTTMFSVGYSQRQYVRDVLIYGFGRTEDVPVGSLISLVGGVDNAELGERLYIGLNLSRGQYIKKIGYLYTLINAGTFYRAKKQEQGLFSFSTNYFSPLVAIPWGHMRHFFNARLTLGMDRFNNEYITLSGREGIGLTNDALIGTKRLLVGYENVLFSRLNLIGFRAAFVTFANVGIISFNDRAFFQSPLYQAYGIGVRLRNENLTFNSFQIRLTWYPNIPNNPYAFRTAFEGIPTLRLRDFDISAPSIVPYR